MHCSIPVGRVFVHDCIHIRSLAEPTAPQICLSSPGSLRVVKDLHFDVEPLDPSDFPVHQVYNTCFLGWHSKWWLVVFECLHLFLAIVHVKNTKNLVDHKNWMVFLVE